jgi:hypothetical protein
MPLPSWRTTNGPPSPSDAIRVANKRGGVDGADLADRGGW